MKIIVMYSNTNEFKTCSFGGQSMNVVIDISHKNTFTIETSNDAYLVYSFSSQKPNNFFKDGQITLTANSGKRIDSGDEPQKIYINVYPDEI